MIQFVPGAIHVHRVEPQIGAQVDHFDTCRDCLCRHAAGRAVWQTQEHDINRIERRFCYRNECHAFDHILAALGCGEHNPHVRMTCQQTHQNLPGIAGGSINACPNDGLLCSTHCTYCLLFRSVVRSTFPRILLLRRDTANKKPSNTLWSEGLSLAKRFLSLSQQHKTTYQTYRRWYGAHGGCQTERE